MKIPKSHAELEICLSALFDAADRRLSDLQATGLQLFYDLGLTETTLQEGYNDRLSVRGIVHDAQYIRTRMDFNACSAITWLDQGSARTMPV